MLNLDRGATPKSVKCSRILTAIDPTHGIVEAFLKTTAPRQAAMLALNLRLDLQKHSSRGDRSGPDRTGQDDGIGRDGTGPTDSRANQV